MAEFRENFADSVNCKNIIFTSSISVYGSGDHEKDENTKPYPDTPYGKSKLEAVQQASIIRLRPVMMTSLATIAGHTPLIFASGAGAGARNAIGLVLVCGMAIGTIFTLYVLPSVYMLLAKDHSKAEHLQAEFQT